MDAAAKQFSFRLPETLIRRVDQCTAELQAGGLDVNRADVVRLLLKHALDATNCKLDLLFKKRAPTQRARRQQ